MSTDLNPPDLERRLREAFARHAAAAALPTPELPTTPHVAVVDRGRRSMPGITRWVALASGAAAVLVGVVFIVLRDSESAPDSIRVVDTGAVPDLASSLPPEPVVATGPPEEIGAPVQPSGTEVLLTETELPADFIGFGSADLASAVAVTVEGHPPLVRYRALAFWGGGLQQLLCVSSGPGSGCQPQWMAAAPDLSQTSAIDNGLAPFDLFVWANVPDEAAYVTWVSTTGAVWQRPVAGIVAFPVTGLHGDGPLTAFDVRGNLLDTVTWGTARERAGTAPPSTTDNLSDVQRNELSELTKTTVQGCLAVEGATWDFCVAETEQVVQERFVEMGGQVLPMSEPPVTVAVETTAP